MDKRRRNRLLVLTPDASQAGLPRITLDTLRGAKARFEPWVLLRYGGPLLADFQAIARVTDVSLWPSRATLALRVRRKLYAASCARVIRCWKPDLIYCNGVGALQIAKWVSLPKVPVVLHVHEMGTALDTHSRLHADLFAKWPDLFIAASQAVEHSLAAAGVPGNRIRVVHSFAPAELATKADLQVRPKSPVIVGASGYTTWCKGVELWLQTAARVKARCGTSLYRFVWVGVSDDLPGRQMAAMVQKLGLEDVVTLVPVTPDPLSHFRDFDVFALTSWEDSCPLVVIENMLLGKPVLCFAGGGGAPEVVGEAGIIVDSFSPAAMADAIVELTEDDARYQSLSQAGRQRALEHFVTTSQVPKIISVFEMITASCGGL